MINLNLTTGLHIRDPQVYRYENSKYLDDFLSNGNIRLGSFEKYRMDKNGAVEDKFEGKSIINAILSDGEAFAYAEAHPNAYVLCASSIKSSDLLRDFERDSCFVISNPILFAQEIARFVPGCTDVLYGACNYQYKIEQYRPDLSIKILADKSEEEKRKIATQILQEAIQTELYFQKSRKYIDQYEYRFVFVTNTTVKPFIDICCPHAAKICMKVNIQDYEKTFEKRE